MVAALGQAVDAPLAWLFSRAFDLAPLALVATGEELNTSLGYQFDMVVLTRHIERSEAA